MVSFFGAVLLSCLVSSGSAIPRLGVVVMQSPEGIAGGDVAAVTAEVFSESGRFEVGEISDSLTITQGEGNLIPVIQQMAAASDLDILLVISIRLPEESERTTVSGDSVMTLQRTTVEVGGRFYSSSGLLLGSSEGTSYDERSITVPADLTGMACEAGAELADNALLQLFPIEIRFTTGEGSTVAIPAGSAAGIDEGMFLFCVASAQEIPRTLDEYEHLRSRGLLQIIDSEPESSTGRLLSGHLAPGGMITAIEHGAPAQLVIAWDRIPVSLVEGEDLVPEPGNGPDDGGSDGNATMNGVRIGLQSFRWGLCFGGVVTATTTDNLSNLGIDLRLGYRVPIATPKLAVRFSAGPEFGFLIQDVPVTYLQSDASAVTIGGNLEACFEYLVFERLGIEGGLSGYFGTDADSWTVQDQYGTTHEAEPWEVYYTTVERDPLRTELGLFYLIF